MQLSTQVQINISYLIDKYECGNDIKDDKDRLILQTTHNEININKEHNRNCCACRVRQFNYIKQYYGKKEKE